MLEPTGSVATDEHQTEAWRPIPGYEGSYEVSDHGRVRSLPRLIHPRDGHTRSHPGRLLKTASGSKGHLWVSLGGGPTGRWQTYIHHLVLVAFVGPRPDGMECCHGDGDPGNNHVGNLRWDTSTANSMDMVRHGTHNNSTKTVCKFKHRLELPNLVQCKLPYRECRTCALARTRVNNARLRHGRELDFNEVADSIYARLEWAA